LCAQKNRYQAGILIDQLTYSYTNGTNATNQVQSVADASGSNSGLVNGATTYTYDDNGNMLSAANTDNPGQNKSFSYNLLNLPLLPQYPPVRPLTRTTPQAINCGK
jgi:YD repeat-containing protein